MNHQSIFEIISVWYVTAFIVLAFFRELVSRNDDFSQAFVSWVIGGTVAFVYYLVFV